MDLENFIGKLFAQHHKRAAALRSGSGSSAPGHTLSLYPSSAASGTVRVPPPSSSMAVR